MLVTNSQFIQPQKIVKDKLIRILISDWRNLVGLSFKNWVIMSCWSLVTNEPIKTRKKASLPPVSLDLGTILATRVLTGVWEDGSILGPANPLKNYMICWSNTESKRWTPVFLAGTPPCWKISSTSLKSLYSSISSCCAWGFLITGTLSIGTSSTAGATFYRTLPLDLPPSLLRLLPLNVGSSTWALMGDAGRTPLNLVLTICG